MDNQNQNIFEEMEYQTGKTYAELLAEIKAMLTELDGMEYDDRDTLLSAVFFAYKSVKCEYNVSHGID